MRAWLLLLLAAPASATPPCESLYRVGSAAFDGDGSLSMFAAEGDGAVWSRISGGTRTTMARTALVIPREGHYFQTGGLWADSRSAVAWYHNGYQLHRLSSGGAKRVLDCYNDWNNGPRGVWAEFRDGHWSIATLCGYGALRELQLYRQDEGGEPQPIGNLQLPGEGDGPAMTEDAPGRYLLFAEGRPISFETGQFSVGDPLGDQPRSPRIASDDQGATLLALDGDYLWMVVRSGSSFAPRRDFYPKAARQAERLLAVGRTRVILQSDQSAFVLAFSSGVWQAERVIPLGYSDQVLDARDTRLAIADASQLRLDDGGQTVMLGTINVMDGRTGACCSFAPAGNPGGLLLILPFLLFFRRRR